MCKNLQRYKTACCFLAQLHAKPLAVGFAACTQVNGHIENSFLDYPYQFALGILLLEMQAAQNAFGTHRLVIFDKYHVQCRLVHIVLLIRLHKIATIISINCRPNDIKPFNRSLGHLNLSHPYN